MEYGTIFLILAGVFGLFMAWGIGANDVANAMATSVGSKALTIRRAVIIAAVFEFAGAVLAGGQVTETIRKGIVDTSLMADSPELLVYGMLSALLAAGIWLLIASRMGWPVSTTHSIVGAIVGFSIVGLGLQSVQWPRVGTIVASWVVSPLLAGTIAYLLFMSVQVFILGTRHPLRNAIRYVPVYMFLTGFTIALITMTKGLKHVGLDTTPLQNYGIAALVGLAVMGIGALFIRRMRFDKRDNRGFRFAGVERVFAVLMVVTACSMAFAHGSNDVANAIGPVAAVLSVVSNDGVVGKQAILPIWVLLLGGAGIVVGLLTLGQRVIATVGQRITDLTPSRGFACELGASITVVLASATGLPISTTHTLVGAVLGVGLARGIAAINLSVVRTIFMSWIITLPVGAVLAILFFFFFKGLFGG